MEKTANVSVGRRKLVWVNPMFGFLWASQVFLQLGENIVSLSLTVLVFKSFGTGAALSTFFFIKAMPSVILGPIAGVLIDRFNRRNLTMMAFLGSAIVAALLVVAQNITEILIAAFLLATALALAFPSLQGALPQVVEKDSLLAANATISATESIARFTAPAISAVFVGMLGTEAGFYVAAAAYFLACIALIPLQLPDPPGANKGPQLTVGLIWSNLVEGLRYLVGSNILFWTTIVTAAIMFADSMVTPLFTIMVKNELSMPPSYIGYLSSAYGGGILFGALILPLLKRWMTENILLYVGTLAIGAQMLFYSRIYAFWVTIPLQVICGIGFSFLLNTVRTVLQMTASNELLGRVLSAVSAFSALIGLFGLKSGGFIADFMGVRAAFMLAGIICIVAGLVFWIGVGLRKPQNFGT